MIVSDFAVNRSTTIFVLLTLILIAGFVCYNMLPREAMPEIKVPIVTVTSTYMGVSPGDMETLLTLPLERQLAGTFKINPSIPQRDLEGSIQQALLLMNNRQLQQRLRNSPLKKRLVRIRNNERMIEELYLAVLARTPNSEETQRYIRYLRKTQSRTEAIEDMLWVLVNSTEFLTKR